MTNNLPRLSTLRNLWRGWLRNESPRRAVIHWHRADQAGLLGLCCVVALVTSWHLLQVPDIKAGMQAPTDVVAPTNKEVQFIRDNQEKGSELIKDTIFVQVIDKEKSILLRNTLKEKLKKIELLAISNNADRIAPINITERELIWLQRSSLYERKVWTKKIELAANRMLQQGLVNNIRFEELMEASSLQLNELGDKEIPARSIGTKILSRTFHRNTNLKQDRSLQGLLEDVITKKSPTIKVKKGDYIIREGEIITPQDFHVLEHFNLVPKSIRLIPFLGVFLEALASCGVLLLIMRREKPCLQPKQGIFALGLILTAQLSKVLFKSAISPLGILVPPTLLLSQGLGSTIALAWLAVCSLLWQIPGGIDEARIMVACSVSALIALQGGRLRSRAQLLQMAFLLPFGALLTEWFFLKGKNIPSSSDALVYEGLILGGVLMLAILLIPIIEKTFGLITKARLLELTDQEHPLLRKLSSEAPGTFEHTMTICGLAEEGARSIGADVDLVRTGALYHDIGKLYAPEWFIENQMEILNPHDELNNPFKSAEILQAHVDQGLKLARKYGLPKPIEDFIPEHQGTLKMGYFLHRAKELNPLTKEKDFRYKGPIPRCRETAILMLADGCEAALRSLDPKATNSEACLTVRKVVESRQIDGQLKESSLTRAEIEIVIRAFVTVWRRMRHKRIPYPTSVK